MNGNKVRLNLETIEVTSFVTMLDVDYHEQKELVAGWGSNWYYTCVGGTSPGTVWCEGTHSWDQTALNC